MLCTWPHSCSRLGSKARKWAQNPEGHKYWGFMYGNMINSNGLRSSGLEERCGFWLDNTTKSFLVYLVHITWINQTRWVNSLGCCSCSHIDLLFGAECSCQRMSLFEPHCSSPNFSMQHVNKAVILSMMKVKSKWVCSKRCASWNPANFLFCQQFLTCVCDLCTENIISQPDVCPCPAI